MPAKPHNMPSIQDRMFAMVAAKDVFRQAAGYSFEYMDGLSGRPVYPDEKALDGLACFEEPLPHDPGDPAEILALLHEKGSPATVAQTGGRYFGFVNGSAVPVAVAAKWLSSVWDQNAALYVISPIASRLEAVCEGWLRELLCLPPETAAGFVTGTSVATFCGLAAGRNALLERAGWDVNACGLFGAPPIRVIAGDEAHATVFKALALLGLGSSSVERVPVDSQGRMDPARLPEFDSRCLVILQAGNVNSGAFDPFEAICPKARDAGAWVHIDGAFGLWAGGSDQHRYLIQGVDQADSWSLDAHKTLNTPYDCGIILCRHRQSLASAMQASGSYILYSKDRDNMLLTPDMSRRSRAVELWAAMKFLGRQGIQDLVDGLCRNALLLAEMLRADGFRILNDVVFNQVLVACESDGQTQKTLSAIQASGECWCGGAVWKGTQAIRVSVCSWATTLEDLERTAKAFSRARKTVNRT